MPVPVNISELSQTAGSNYPQGTDSPSTLDDVQRAIASFIALLRDSKGLTSVKTLASAGTVDIGGADSYAVEITGTTTITSLGTNYSGPRYIRFTGVLTLTHNASLLNLPGAASITTAAGDSCVAVPNSTGNGWHVTSYQVYGNPPDSIPIGASLDWNGTTAPNANWMIENGAAISRTTYATLFARIGTTFGAGDGSTTFNIPNSVNRTSVGATGLYAVGATGGSKDAIVVSHGHSVNDPGHGHFIPGSEFGTAGWGNGGAITKATQNLGEGRLGAQASATGISINNAGSSGTDANMPPYIGKLKIIKVL